MWSHRAELSLASWCSGPKFREGPLGRSEILENTIQDSRCTVRIVQISRRQEACVLDLEFLPVAKGTSKKHLRFFCQPTPHRNGTPAMNPSLRQGPAPWAERQQHVDSTGRHTCSTGGPADWLNRGNPDSNLWADTIAASPVGSLAMPFAPSAPPSPDSPPQAGATTSPRPPRCS